MPRNTKKFPELDMQEQLRKKEKAEAHNAWVEKHEKQTEFSKEDACCVAHMLIGAARAYRGAVTAKQMATENKEIMSAAKEERTRRSKRFWGMLHHDVDVLHSPEQLEKNKKSPTGMLRHVEEQLSRQNLFHFPNPKKSPQFGNAQENTSSTPQGNRPGTPAPGGQEVFKK